MFPPARHPESPRETQSRALPPRGTAGRARTYARVRRIRLSEPRTNRSRPAKVLAHCYEAGLISVTRDGEVVRIELTPAGREHLRKSELASRATDRFRSMIQRLLRVCG